MEWVSSSEDTRSRSTFNYIHHPVGKIRYKTAPQGYLASGDAYTHRYDKITMGVKDIKRVIDDTLLYSKDIESSFHYVAQYLKLVGRTGIILNPDKLNFAEDEVD